jgi:outer membrane protein OmpA-like peptidoglycan-associated protein
VQFDLDKADIRPDAAVILDEAASLLSANPGTQVAVGGHTDSSGSDAYNQSLSERRAASVRDYLASKGVDASRLSTAGFGESQPVADNATAEGRALNRRVELSVKE